MHQVLRHFTNDFMVVYFDDILMYSRIIEEYVAHVEKVLEILRQNELYANP